MDRDSAEIVRLSMQKTKWIIDLKYRLPGLENSTSPPTIVMRISLPFLYVLSGWERYPSEANRFLLRNDPP